MSRMQVSGFGTIGVAFLYFEALNLHAMMQLFPNSSINLEQCPHSFMGSENYTSLLQLSDISEEYLGVRDGYNRRVLFYNVEPLRTFKRDLKGMKALRKGQSRRIDSYI